jgi:flagellar assembly factor FliW
MSRCQTKYFGELEYGSEAVVRFRAGLPGFENEKEFILIDWPDLKPMVFLQSPTAPELCFPTLPILTLAPDYQLTMAKADRTALGLKHQPVIGRDVACLAIVNVRELVTVANLLAPVVIELKTRRAVQAVVAGSGYSHEQPFGAEQPAETMLAAS